MTEFLLVAVIILAIAVAYIWGQSDYHNRDHAFFVRNLYSLSNRVNELERLHLNQQENHAKQETQKEKTGRPASCLPWLQS